MDGSIMKKANSERTKKLLTASLKRPLTRDELKELGHDVDKYKLPKSKADIAFNKSMSKKLDEQQRLLNELKSKVEAKETKKTTRKGYWKTVNGYQLKIAEMSDSHITNCIRMMQ